MQVRCNQCDTHKHRHADKHTPLTKVACDSFGVLRCIGWCCVAVFPPALHPTHRVCLLFRGILHARMCVGTQTCCVIFLCYRHSCGLEADIVCLSFTHIIYLLASYAAWLLAHGAIYCKVTEWQCTGFVRGASMFVYVLMSPISENSFTCANDSIPAEIYWADLWSSLFPRACCVL